MAHLSTLKLHQLRYGELTPADESEARAHLSSCERCASRMQAQEAHRAAFVLEPVPQALRTPPSPGFFERFRLYFIGGGALVFAILLASVFAPGAPNPVADATPDERIKDPSGLLAFEVRRDSAAGPELLSEGASLSEGDVVQFRYHPASFRYVTFAGVDGSGSVEVYRTVRAPEDGTNGLLRAPFALTLDGTPGRQQFFAVFTKTQPSNELTQKIVAGEATVPDGTLRKITLQKR